MAKIPATRASLLVRLRNPRDEAAWNEFVNLYGPLLYGYARKQGLQDADAADLGQDVLSAVAGAIGRLAYDPSRGTFRNWLFTVLRRRWLLCVAFTSVVVVAATVVTFLMSPTYEPKARIEVDPLDHKNLSTLRRLLSSPAQRLRLSGRVSASGSARGGRTPRGLQKR